VHRVLPAEFDAVLDVVGHWAEPAVGAALGRQELEQLVGLGVRGQVRSGDWRGERV